MHFDLAPGLTAVIERGLDAAYMHMYLFKSETPYFHCCHIALQVHFIAESRSTVGVLEPWSTYWVHLNSINSEDGGASEENGDRRSPCLDRLRGTLK